MMHHPLHPHAARPQQRGMSLIVVLLLLVIVSMLGAASMQIAGMGEHGARNDRDMQLALQSAEAALIEAEVDLTGPNPNGGEIGNRTADFKAGNARFPGSKCGKSSKAKGLCALETSSSKKATWLTADFEGGSDTASFGDFTPSSFQSA